MSASPILLFANNAGSSLAGSITTTATSLNLQSGGGALFPSPAAGQYFVITAIDAATGLLREIMWCTARSGDTLTVVRAKEGTTGLAWNAGDLIQHLWTAGQAGMMLQSNQLFTPSTTWYVDGTNGTDDTLHGQSSGTGAFRTISYAVSYISLYFSLAQVTVNIAAGTYAGFTVNQSSILSWKFVGAGAGSTIISSPNVGTNGGIGVYALYTNVIVSGCTIKASGTCIRWEGPGAQGSLINCTIDVSLTPQWAIVYTGGANGNWSGTIGTIAFSAGTCSAALFNVTANAQLSFVGGTINFPSSMGSGIYFISLSSGGSAANSGSAYTTFTNASNFLGAKYSCATAGGYTANGLGTGYLPGGAGSTVTSPGYYAA